jgi:hypothetical protein
MEKCCPLLALLSSGINPYLIYLYEGEPLREFFDGFAKFK